MAGVSKWFSNNRRTNYYRQYLGTQYDILLLTDKLTSSGLPLRETFKGEVTSGNGWEKGGYAEMNKLTDRADIKKYVLGVIRTGNKREIIRVLKHYYEWERKQEKSDPTYQKALEVFDISTGDGDSIGT